MKVKTLILLFVIALVFTLVTIGIFSSNSDTDTISEAFTKTINVISIRQHPSNDELLIVVYEYYDSYCGCYEETTININPLGYKADMENIKIPSSIHISGWLENNIYLIFDMRIVK